MEQHDVVMECTRYTLLENGDRSYQNPSTWTNAGSNFSSALGYLIFKLPNMIFNN